MNATVAQTIKTNRQNKARTIVADFDSMTGITSDGQHVEFHQSTWRWHNSDTGAVVEHGHITWIVLETE